MITRKIFDEAPVDYRGVFTQKWHELLDLHEDELNEINSQIADENDWKKIIYTGLDKRSVDEYIDILNKMPEECRSILFVGATIYKNPDYILIIGPISFREMMFYLEGIEV